jgi:hypothetical protein
MRAPDAAAEAFHAVDISPDRMACMRERAALRDPKAARETIAEVVALTQAELRDALCGYHIVSFADERERRRFVTEPDARFQMIEETLYRGSVRTDDNKVVELAV